MDISELLKKEKKPEASKTDDEFTLEFYLREIEEMKNFERPEDRLSWPTPIGRKWKN